jgi:cobalt-precorrin 5A hydrolase
MVVNLDSFCPEGYFSLNCEKTNNIKKDIAGVVVVSNRLDLKITQIIPENIVVGIGCRRGTPATSILEAIEDAMEVSNLHMDSIRHLATVDVKADETGLLEAGKMLGKDLIIIGREEIKTVEDMYEGSDFVEKTIGVKCVSAPAAYLSSNKNGKFIKEKKRYNGVTVSIYEE